jgi:YYY domain-containing protein
VLFDWFAREGWIVLNWWLLVTLAGASALPLCVRLLGALPDKGYTLARAVGLLLTAYLFWLLGSLGFLRNTTGGILLAWLIVLGLSLAVYMRGRERFDWRAWWRDSRPVVISAEILFAVLLLGWAIIRAYQPELRSTEKPMDLMFINSIIRSPAFPPNDAWMAGYSISYYYFGYFMAAMLSTATGISGAIGLNMMVSLVFALTGLTVFGVVCNLARAYQPFPHTEQERSGVPALLAGLLGAVMVILMGNFQTALIEYPYETRTASPAYLSFTGTQAREGYPQGITAAPLPEKSDPATWETWWWFRASRVLNDFNLDGTVANSAQPIDEFPQFSFILSDSHPHVMALPFAALALGLALNLLLTGTAPSRVQTIFYALCVGALVFLNTWDGPIYILALLGADALRRLIRAQGRLSLDDIWALIRLGLVLGVLTAIFYLPFLVSFRSQASGLLPNIINPTYFQQYFIMFGPFILIIGFFLWAEVRAGGRRMNWAFGLQAAGVLLVGLLVVMLALILVALLVPELSFVIGRFAEQYGGLGGALPLVLKRRLDTLLTTVVLLVGFVMIIGRLFPRRFRVAADASRDERQVVTYSHASGFALLVVALGLGLSLVPEFFYLRDNFGTRINTIFKFYYQAWLVFSVASAYAVYILLTDARLIGAAMRGILGAVAIVAVSAGLLYPIYSIYSHVFVETGYAAGRNTSPISLDGAIGFTTTEDASSIECLKNMTQGQNVVVAEAMGDPYHPENGRVAALTGIPSVMGWANHEAQWRGSTYQQVARSRPEDIPTLYKDLRWDVAQSIIQRYGIDYIFYGSTERSAYSSAGEDKFRENLEAVCPSVDLAGNMQSVFYRIDKSQVSVSR